MTSSEKSRRLVTEKPTTKTSRSLAARIFSFRKKKLGMSLRKFAEAVGVKHSVVFAWEKGELPSTDRLIQMANLASDRGFREESLEFMRTAGVDLYRLRADVGFEFAADLAQAHASSAFARAVRIPVIEEFFVSPKKRLMERRTQGALLSVDIVAPAPTLVCAGFKKRGPSIFGSGDLLIIDRAITEPHRLGSTLTAVFFAPFPDHAESDTLEARLRDILEARQADGGESAPGVSPADAAHDLGRPEFLKAQRSMPPLLPPTEADYAEMSPATGEAVRSVYAPGIAVGWIAIDSWSGVRAMKDKVPDDPWRLVLQLHSPAADVGPRYPLTDWQKHGDPRGSHETALGLLLRPGVWIAGKIVGWISYGSRPPLPAADGG